MAQLNLSSFAARTLSLKERRILLLVRESCPASRIAAATGFPKSSVAAILLRLENYGLIKRYKGSKYNILYELSNEAQNQLEGEGIPKISAFKVHRVGMVFKIRERFGEYSQDPRISIIQKSWRPKGKNDFLRINYTIHMRPGEPAVTITVQPHSLMVQLTKGSRVGGISVEEATFRAYQFCIKAKDRFVDLQHQFGCRITLEPTGRPIYKEHIGFFVKAEGQAAKGGVTIPGWSMDKSLEQVRPDLREVENTEGYKDSIEQIRPIDNFIEKANELPDMIKQAMDPLNANILKVEALMQGGTTAQMKVDQLVGVIGHMLETMNKQSDEISELRKLLAGKL